jgi:hypothetical protein
MVYTITLKVENENGEIIGQRSSELLEIIDQSIPDVPKWIENWEERNLEEAF